MRFSVLLFFVTVFVSLSFPQQGEFIYKNLTPDDGLPSNETYDLMQSEDGYMYIATDQGLARFDGEEFKVYNEKDGIKGSAVFNVYPDPSGRIWMRTIGFPYFLEKDSIVKFPLFGIHDSQFGDSTDKRPLFMSTLLFDSSSFPYAVLSDKFSWIFLYDDGEYHRVNKFKTYENGKFHNPKNSKETYAFKMDTYGNILKFFNFQEFDVDTLTLVDSLGYIIIAEPNSLKLHTKPLPWVVNKINKKQVLAFNRDGKCLNISLNDFRFEQTEIPKKAIKFHFDSTGLNFLLTQNGLYQCVNGFSQFIRLNNYFITSLFKDNEANYWMTDHNNGVLIIPNLNFQHLNFQLNENATSLCLWKYENDFHTEVSDGHVFKNETDTIIKLNYIPRINNTRARTLSFFESSFYLSSSEIHFDDMGHNIFLPKEAQITIFRSARKYSDSILLATNTGPVLLLTSDFNRSFRLDTLNGVLRFFPRRLNEEFLGKRKMVVRTEDVMKSGNLIWAATADGLLQYTKDSVISFSNQHPILSSRLTALDDFHPNYLAIGSRSSGVFLMHKMKHNLLFPISHSDKIKSSAIRSLYSSNDTLYATSNKGLFMFKLSNDTFYQIAHFDSKNGLPTNDISDIEEHDGKIWIATKKGLVFFQKGSLKPDDYYTPIHLTHFSFDDHQRRIDSTFIQFQKDQRDLTFWYKGISFKSAGDLKYKLILSGPSKDSLVTQNTETRFTNLEPGTYTLKIWAQNNTGNWSLKPATLTFSIPEKFHESIWFYILCFLAFGLFTAFLTFLYQQQKKKLLERKLSTNELEQRALAAQMNPHFIHNTLAAIQQLFNAGDMEECNNYIAMFSKLVRLNLNSIREGYISVETEIKRLQLYLDIEKTRFGNRLSYSIEVDPKVDTSYMEIPAMLLQPFVENALWHGLLPKPEGGEIHIKFGSKEKHLIIEILDNGVGYNPSAEKKRDKEDPSVAMEITKNRLNLLSKKSGQTNDFTIQNRKDITGTQVIVTLYIGED
jgi:anti-sigma regulatory factor (Ser/Thr protein kinase)